MVSQVERYYPRTRRAVGPVSQTDRFYDDTRNDVRCPYADELRELDEVKKHLGRTDNPHGVTAEQVGAVPLLGAGESADPATHGKTAVVTQNGDEGGFAVSGQAGADPDSEAYVTRYQRESITAFGDGADETAVERYLIGPKSRNLPESILRVGDLAGTKPVTVTPESVGYRQKVTLALQIDRETIAHANSADAIDWVPSSKAVQAALDKKAEKTHTHTTAQVTGLDAALAQKANSADVYPKAQTYTKTEVDNLVAQAVAAAKTQLLEQLKGLYAPLSSVQATVGGTTYRWAWDDTFQTFAMQAVEEA